MTSHSCVPDACTLDLQLIRDRLRAVSEAGGDDLLACVNLPCCPVPIEPLAGTLR